MILLFLSTVMLALSLTYLSDTIQGAFVGVWFALLLLAGWQTVRAGASPTLTEEQRQAAYKEQLSSIRSNKSRRRRG